MESVLVAALLGSLLLPLPQRAPPALTTRRHAPVVAREWKPGQGFGAAEEQLEEWVDEDDTDDGAIGLTAEEMDGKRDRLLEKWADFVQLGGVKEQQAPVLHRVQRKRHKIFRKGRGWQTPQEGGGGDQKGGDFQKGV